MAQDFAELTALFRDALRDRFGLEGDDVPGATRLFFALGTPLPDDGFRNVDGAYFPLRAMEFMSHHCNVAPRLVGETFQPTVNEIDDLYGLLLLGSSPASAADVALLGAVKLEAKSDFDIRLGSTIPPGFDSFRPTHAMPELWFDQTQAGNWSAISIAQAPPAPPPSPPSGGGGGGGVGGPGSRFPVMFRPIDPHFTDLLAEPVTVESTKRLKTAANLDLALAADDRPFAHTHFADPSLLANAVVAIAPEPGDPEPEPLIRIERDLPFRLADALEAETALARHAHRSISRDELGAHDRLIRHAAAAIRIQDLAFAGGVEVTSHSFNLDAELCLVSLRRPWLSTAFLQLRNWFVPSLDAGELSSGDNPEDGAPLAAIPVACVLIRDLRIHAQWTTEDQAQALSSSHLGPFSLAGRRFDTSTTTATLSVPGMQSVGWLCDPMPALPPRSSPG